MQSIGFYNMPIDSFFVLEVIEAIKVLEKMRERIKFEHELNYIAMSNAIGKSFARNYKYIDIFEDNSKKKEVTEEEKEELKAYFEEW